MLSICVPPFHLRTKLKYCTKAHLQLQPGGQTVFHLPQTSRGVMDDVTMTKSFSFAGKLSAENLKLRSNCFFDVTSMGLTLVGSVSLTCELNS